MNAVDNTKGYTVEDTKFAHFGSYSWLGNEISMDMFIRKFTHPGGFRSYSLYLDARSSEPNGFSSPHLEYFDGDIKKNEIEQAIGSLKYIKDSLLKQLPDHRFDYYLILKDADMKIDAYFDPYKTGFFKNSGWLVVLYFNNSTISPKEVVIKEKDINDFIKALNLSKEKIDALK